MVIADRSIHVPSVVETLEAGGDFPARVLDSAEDERAAVVVALFAPLVDQGRRVQDLDELRPGLYADLGPVRGRHTPRV